MRERKIVEIFDRVPRSLKRHRITLSKILKIFLIFSLFTHINSKNSEKIHGHLR